MVGEQAFQVVKGGIALRQVVERELFFTSWGLNLDWDVPESAVDLDELLVQTQTTVVSHRLEVLPVADSQR